MRSCGAMLAVVLTLVAEAAGATDCTCGHALRAYEAAVAAQAAGRAAEAMADFRALAAQGFAPAQRRLGEALAAEGKVGAGLVWLRLALKRGDHLASAPLFVLERGLDVQTQLAVDDLAEKWRPSLGPCGQNYLERRRSAQPIRPDEFLSSIVIDHGVDGSPQDLNARLGALLLYLGDTQPDLLPYLTALDTVRLARLNAAAAVDERPGTSPRLVVNVNMLARKDTSLLSAVGAAVRDTIHRRTDPPTTLETAYRGRALRLSSYAQNDRAIALIQATLDLAETLPSDLKALAAEPRRLVVEPTRLGEEKLAIATLIVKKGERDGYVRFANILTHPAHDVVAGLVNTGYRLKQLKAGKEADDRTANALSERAREFLRGR